MDSIERSERTAENTARHDGLTRQSVLKLLKTRGSATAGELARELGLTEMGVRRHLAALERDGYVTPTLVKQAMGRPAYAYGLTEDAEHFFPKNYHQLAIDLLEQLELEGGADGAVGRMFEARKRKLFDRYAERMEGKRLPERVQELADIQNGGGYMVEVEIAAGDGANEAYLLHEYNCPIAQVALRYQQACSCELALFRELLDADVERTECFAKGGTKCTYRIANALSAK